MEAALKVLTAMLLNKFSSTEAGSKMMGGINSAKSVNSLWQKFQPQTTGV